MKKSTLKKYLTSLKNALNEAELNEAFKSISAAIENFQEEEIKVDKEHLPAPVGIRMDELALFSDGACRGNPGPGSWGIVIQNIHGEVLLTDSGFDEHTTNNKMELSGAIEAIEQAIALKTSNSFVLFTDSKYVVDGVHSWSPGWKKRGWKKADGKAPENLELWQQLDELVNAKNINVRLEWVKGHAGHPQNELCDQLANEELDRNL